MKKILLSALLAGFAATGFAQKARIVDANAYLQDKDYKKAIAAINEATAPGSETVDNAKAWFTRGRVYFQAATDSTSGVANAGNEATRSFMKVVELKPDYPADEINNLLSACAVLAYNDAIEAFGAKNYDKAYQEFQKVNAIYAVNGGKRFASDVQFLRLSRDAQKNAAVSALYAEKYPESLAILNEIKTKGSADTSVYQTIMEIYGRQKNDALYLQTLQEARQKFPGNANFRNLELNYYTQSGDPSQLLKKLEEAVAADPNNADLQFNLGSAYLTAATPKDREGNDLPKPANADELMTKAQAAFEAALRNGGEKPEYNYLLGAVYYNKAISFNGQMNALVGNKATLDAATQKKYDGLKILRDDEFKKAMPYMEKAMQGLVAKGSNVNNEERNTLLNSLYALREIYSRVGTKAQQDAIKAKLDEF